VKTRTRALLVGLALLLVLGMGVHHASQYSSQWPYPDHDALASEYDQHVGSETLVFGTVQSADDGTDTAHIEVEHSDGTFEMTVEDFQADVRPGGVVQVYGPLRPEYTITADRVVVVNPAGSSTLFKYGVSLVGAALVTVLFFREWGVDVDELAFEVRDDG
jgi:preprotein translocase subunit SecF